MTTRKSLHTCTQLAALALLLGGCAATVPPPKAWTPAPIGTSWSSMQRNTGSYGPDQQMSITRVANIDWQGSPAMVLKTGTGGSLVQQLTDGRWLATLAPDGRTVATYDPPAGWTPPLTVGERWNRQQKVTNVGTGRTTSYEWNCQVAAFETVTVPAGTFDAYRVECNTTLDTQDVYWTAPGVHPFLKTRFVRGPKHPAGPGTQESQLLKLPA